ncbi:DNA-3-methyladenine glycosylase family protein [Corticibacter populi]|nr:DNA-3-methyladenine glycosylase [Corticibacter populi]
MAGKPRSKTPATVPAASDGSDAVARPDYWDEACRHLVKKDRILRRLIPQYQGASIESRGDAFATLARSIVGQQISVAAAKTVWGRFEALAGSAMTPAQILVLAPTDMRAAGLSMRKIEYLRDLALHFGEERLSVQDWPQWEDEAIISELTAVRGIGRWTAEMFLMFHLLRPNVLPLDDVGLIQGISRNYFSGEPVSRSDAREVAEAWKPWRSVATWYMWRSLAVPQAY